LTDLGAWANLNKLSFSLTTGLNRCFSSAENLNSDSFYILKSSDFFEKLKRIDSGPVFDLLKSMGKRDAIMSISSTFPDIDLSVEEAIGFCPLLLEYYSEDCTKLYSLLQYYEILFLIENIIFNNPAISTIKFILPNDEDKYYPNLPCLENDISIFLKNRLNFTGFLSVEILCFTYGKKISQRPYLNTTQGLVESRLLDLDDIVEMNILCTSLKDVAL